MSAVPVEKLRQMFRLEPSTGAVYRRGDKSRRRVGWVRPDGYRVVKVEHAGRRVQMMVHRLVWALHHGEHAALEVDHKDGNRRNNRPSNLRLASRRQNVVNRRVKSKLPTGVDRAGKKFVARIRTEDGRLHLGTFDCPNQAHLAWRAKAVELHGDYVR